MPSEIVNGQIVFSARDRLINDYTNQVKAISIQQHETALPSRELRASELTFTFALDRLSRGCRDCQGD